MDMPSLVEALAVGAIVQHRDTTVHWVLLGSAPTVAEAMPAIEWLQAGGSLQTVIDGARSSDEYGARHG